MQGEFFLKINKRACTSIRHTRVLRRWMSVVSTFHVFLSSPFFFLIVQKLSSLWTLSIELAVMNLFQFEWQFLIFNFIKNDILFKSIIHKIRSNFLLNQQRIPKLRIRFSFAKNILIRLEIHKSSGYVDLELVVESSEQDTKHNIALITAVIRQLRLEFKFPAKIKMAFSQMLM